ncbi:hypothetical protein [Sinanaerobacter chloroacetimidivorans]|uniref:Uncharacterized protein n=1 Tax=Sinanaerobacter chloroacetimidivorans TaxID=2818044 RepID=A0A8J7VYY9_9FIRM|nr:hypothetical protein [Sinanaerobacter chloroacetimidivorans]MBR0596593.1 hypothetical protein [Sinanaerobacter chloroacetimidivorans]
MASMDELRKQFKAQNPFFFGGFDFKTFSFKEPSDEYVMNYFGVKEKVTDGFKNVVTTTGKAVDAGSTVVSSSFDFIVWIKENWQISIVGLVALIVILRH